jgi:hypothetical protein
MLAVMTLGFSLPSQSVYYLGNLCLVDICREAETKGGRKAVVMNEDQ